MIKIYYKWIVFIKSGILSWICFHGVKNWCWVMIALVQITWIWDKIATLRGNLSTKQLIVQSFDKFIRHVSCSGLGRTGVLIACYLIYSLRVRANDAIRFVRMKRPSAIQTRGQILCIQDFEHFVLPQMIVFPLNSTIGDRKPCSLQSCLKKQHNVLHGYEQRTFKHIPKVSFYFSHV